MSLRQKEKGADPAKAGAVRHRSFFERWKLPYRGIMSLAAFAIEAVLLFLSIRSAAETAGNISGALVYLVYLALILSIFGIVVSAPKIQRHSRQKTALAGFILNIIVCVILVGLYIWGMIL